MFEKAIPLEPEKAEVVTLAACTLHNYLQTHKASGFTSDSDMANDGSWRAVSSSGVRDLQCRTTGQNYSLAAADIRNNFCAYFNGPGAVEWQDRMI